LKLPNAERAQVAQEKIAGYLLSESHPVGRAKARFFRSLGFRSGNAQALRSELLRIALEGEGAEVEGPILKGPTDFVGWHPIVIRHGMTVGELARMFQAERPIDVDLTVIPLRGWSRAMWQDEAGLPWIDTSPAMRSLEAAGLYPGIGILESAISVGRGTPTPFEVIGAPYIDPGALLKALPPLPGITFTPTRFTPDSSIFAGKECGGLQMKITDRRTFRPVATGVAIATALERLYPNEFAIDKLDRLLRDPATLQAIRDDQAADWTADEKAFAARRVKYLLY